MVRCSKVRYPSRARADRAVATIRKMGDARQKKPTRSYLCPLCNGWHLTSEPR